MRLTQTNSILRSHAETIISHALKVPCCFSQVHKIIIKYHFGYNLLLVCFALALNTFQQYEFLCRASISLVSGFNDYFMVIFKGSHFDSEWRNEGKATCTSIFQNFLRGWEHARGYIGGMPSKGLGILLSAEVANLLGDVGAWKFWNLDA